MRNNKCAFVTVVGEPNAGKSTLVNALVGQKVSIVSRKAQTTRRQIRGIVEFEDTQLVFVDTPGFFKPSSNLEKAIINNFKSSYDEGTDLVILVIDPTTKYYTSSINFIEKLSKEKTPLAVVINKVDIAKKELLLKLASELSKYHFIKEIFMVSALKDDGIDDIRTFLKNSAPDGPWLYEPNSATDTNLKFRLSEITREKLFNKLEKELPYSLYVETELLKLSEKKAKIYQSIVVLKDSQKGIVLGKGGTMVKIVKEEAAADMKNLLNKKIELKLFVKVREKWTEKKDHLQNAFISD